MASMFFKHRVAGFSTWKPVFDEHETIRRDFGATAHSAHSVADDLNIVVLALPPPP